MICLRIQGSRWKYNNDKLNIRFGTIPHPPFSFPNSSHVYKVYSITKPVSFIPESGCMICLCFAFWSRIISDKLRCLTLIPLTTCSNKMLAMMLTLASFVLRGSLLFWETHSYRISSHLAFSGYKTGYAWQDNTRAWNLVVLVYNGLIVSLSVKGDSGAEMWLKAKLSLMCSHEGKQQIGLQTNNLISTNNVQLPLTFLWTIDIWGVCSLKKKKREGEPR